MSRARMIKPELRTSEKVASWPIEVRYFWVLFWGYVDNYGKGKDNTKLIKADCFPLDEDITTDHIESWLELFEACGVIVRYEFEGSRYLAVKNWDEHQSVTHKGKDIYPDYADIPLDNKDVEAFQKASGNIPESVENIPLKLNKIKLNKSKEPTVVVAQERHDVQILCETLADLIVANGSKKPTIGKSWLDAARLLLDSDERDLQDALSLLKWSQQHDFWKSNILSMPTFRKQYDKLRLQRAGELNDPRTKSVIGRGAFYDGNGILRGPNDWQQPDGRWVQG